MQEFALGSGFVMQELALGLGFRIRVRVRVCNAGVGVALGKSSKDVTKNLS